MVLDLGMVVSHHPVQIAMTPAQVMAQHQLAGSVGILALIVWGDVGHIGLYDGRKCLRVPKFTRPFNGQIERLTNGLLPIPL